MPAGYIVQAQGRHGAVLRQARGNHELEVRGPSARLGLLLPHHTTTTTQNPDGTPLTVRVPYLLACWLVLGCLLVSDEVRDLYLFEHVVGAERIGAALDCLLGSYDTMEAHTPSCPMPDACYPLVCLLCVGGISSRGAVLAAFAPSWRCPQLSLFLDNIYKIQLSTGGIGATPAREEGRKTCDEAKRYSGKLST